MYHWCLLLPAPERKGFFFLEGADVNNLWTQKDGILGVVERGCTNLLFLREIQGHFHFRRKANHDRAAVLSLVINS